MKKKYLLLAITLLSCTLVRVYDLKPVNKEVKKNIEKVESNLYRIESHEKQKEKLLYQLNKGELKSTFHKQIQDLDGIKSTLVDHFKNLKTYVQNHKLIQRNKVQSDDKDYGLVEEYEKELNIQFDQIEKDLKNYQAKDQEINNYLESSKVYLVQVKKIENEIKNNIDAFNKQLDKVEKQPLNPEKKIIISKLKNKIIEFAQELEIMLKEVYSQGKDEVYLIPGMKAHGYTEKLKNYSDETNLLVKSFNEIGK